METELVSETLVFDLALTWTEFYNIDLPWKLQVLITVLLQYSKQSTYTTKTTGWCYVLRQLIPHVQ
jgi:hypothetical protein